MESNQLVELMCETTGDPTPTLTWSNKVTTLLTRDPPLNKSHSTLNRLTVGVGGPNVSSIYMCTASNIEGISYALLNLVSKKVDNSDRINNSSAIYNRMVFKQKSNNCAIKRFAQFMEFNLDINFIWKILYFITCIVVNTYFF